MPRISYWEMFEVGGRSNLDDTSQEASHRGQTPPLLDFCPDLWKQRASLVTQMVKNLPVMQETWVRFLGRENPLEKEMAAHSNILPWRIPWTEEPGRLQSVR